MALVKNTALNYGGDKYILDGNTIVMGNDLLLLCTKEVGAKTSIYVFKYNTATPETASSISPVGVSAIPQTSAIVDNELYFNAVLVKSSDTKAFILVNETGTTGWVFGVSIYALTKSGAVYTLNKLKTNILPSITMPNIMPVAALWNSFKCIGDWIFFAGFRNPGINVTGDGTDENRLLGYNPVLNQSVELAYNTIGDGSFVNYVTGVPHVYNNEPVVLYVWNNRLWIVNIYGKIITTRFDTSTKTFDLKYLLTYSGYDDTFNNSTEGGTTANLADPFGDGFLWMSLASAYKTKIIRITDNGYGYSPSLTDYELVGTAIDLSAKQLCLFGTQSHQKYGQTARITSTTAYTVASTHPLTGSQESIVCKITKDDIAKTMRVDLIYSIPNSSVYDQLANLDGKVYVTFGHGGAYIIGYDYGIYRIDETLPPKIEMYTDTGNYATGTLIDIVGECFFDPTYSQQVFGDVALYRGEQFISTIKAVCYRNDPMLTYPLTITTEDRDVDFTFRGVVVNGPMDGITVISSPFRIDSSMIPEGQGSIGSFYFGPTFTNALIDSLTIPKFEINVMDFTQDATIERVNPAMFIMSVPKLSAYTHSPFDFDFSATPLAGSSPLKVKFTAYNYEPKDQYANTWEASEFHWWFDYANYPSQITITKTDTTTHMYCYPSNSRKFDVKLCVKYKVKNR